MLTLLLLIEHIHKKSEGDELQAKLRDSTLARTNFAITYTRNLTSMRIAESLCFECEEMRSHEAGAESHYDDFEAKPYKNIRFQNI